MTPPSKTKSPKTIKRVGRGYRNHRNYRCRIIGYAPRPIAA